MFSLTPSRNMSAEKFLKTERFLAVLQQHTIFNIKWVEVRKMNDFYRAKLYCKMNDLFPWSLLALRLSARKPETKKKLWKCPYIWANIKLCKAVYARNNIFKKRILNMTESFWIIYILIQISFWRLLKGVLACVLFYFSSLANHGDQHLYSASLSTKKKLLTALLWKRLFN